MAVGTIATRGRVSRRRWSDTALGSWVTTTDHKKIGILYIYTGIIFFFLGGIEASLIRWQLAQPNSTVLTPEMYDQVFTMHGTTMIFLFVMPVMAGFGNFLVPLMIGARDIGVSPIERFGILAAIFGGIFLYSSSFRVGAKRWLVQLCPTHRSDTGLSHSRRWRADVPAAGSDGCPGGSRRRTGLFLGWPESGFLDHRCEPAWHSVTGWGS